jgi:hypothetical protein
MLKPESLVAVAAADIASSHPPSLAKPHDDKCLSGSASCVKDTPSDAASARCGIQDVWLQLPLLRLFRTLCQASVVAAHLIRSAGGLEAIFMKAEAKCVNEECMNAHITIPS